MSVYILLMGNRPLEPAQNKLLKLIEEPPAHGVFLLVCPSAELLLPTIRSRVQSFLLLPPSEEEAAAYVAAREGVDPPRARELATLCRGNIGRMLQELAGGEEAQAFSIAVALAKGLLEPGEHAMLLAAAPLLKNRELFREVLTRLSLYFPGRPGAAGRGQRGAGGRAGAGGQAGGPAHEAAGTAAALGGRLPPEAGPQRQHGAAGHGFLRAPAGSRWDGDKERRNGGAYGRSDRRAV